MTRRLLVLLAVAAVGCEGSRPGSAERAAATPASAVRFDPEVLDLGRVVAGGTARGTADLVNASSAAVEVTSMDVPCECTTAGVTVPRTLAPGERLAVPVTLDLSKLPQGGFTPEDGADVAILERTLAARIGDVSSELRLVVEVVGSVLVEPAQLDLGIVPYTGTARGSIVVSPGAGAPQVTVRAATSEAERLAATTSLDAGTSRVDVAWGPFAAPGRLTAELVLGTDSPALPEIRVPVRVEAIDLVVLRPARIHVTEASLVRPVVTSVVVRRADGGPLEVLGVQADTTRVEASLRPATRPDERTIDVVVAVPMPPKAVDSVLYIDTNVTGAPRVSLPIHVKARDP